MEAAHDDRFVLGATLGSGELVVKLLWLCRLLPSVDLESTCSFWNSKNDSDQLNRKAPSERWGLFVVHAVLGSDQRPHQSGPSVVIQEIHFSLTRRGK